MSQTESSQKGFSPEQLHRRQAIWQIYLPAFLGVAVFLALCVWVIVFTIGYVPDAALPDQQSPPAKVAVIWLILPTCFGGLFQMAIFGGLVFVLGRGIKGLPLLAHKMQGSIERLSAVIHRFADSVAKPVVIVGSQKAGWDRFIDFIAFWKHKA
jgi:hypothetical protein